MDSFVIIAGAGTLVVCLVLLALHYAAQRVPRATNRQARQVQLRHGYATLCNTSANAIAHLRQQIATFDERPQGGHVLDWFVHELRRLSWRGNRAPELRLPDGVAREVRAFGGSRYLTSDNCMEPHYALEFALELHARAMLSGASQKELTS